MINYRFLNYKKYDRFLDAYESGSISNDSIVFIQDKRRIWARGQEYMCDTPAEADIEGSTLTFGDSLFTITLDGNTITLTDNKGNSVVANYATIEDLDKVKAHVDNLAPWESEDPSSFVKGPLHKVATSG